MQYVRRLRESGRSGETRGKLKKNPKHQTPNPKKTPKTKSQENSSKNSILEFGIWGFFGIWILGFGLSLALGAWILELFSIIIRRAQPIGVLPVRRCVRSVVSCPGDFFRWQ